jgi:hypothetical protein
MTIDFTAARGTLELAHRLRLLADAERREIEGAFDEAYPFAAAVRAADSMHTHVKVESVEALPHEALRAAGGRVENEKEGYVKYAFLGGMNLIFSSIDVSEDDRRQGSARRTRPFLDHFGIDLRQESAEVRALFEAVPERAGALGWPLASQGGEGQPVYCCHVTVSRKHWVYPRAQVPVELAFGPLAVHPDKSGCDLRPSDPSLGLAAPSGCGAQKSACAK